MRRVFFALLFALLLAACSSAPQRTSLSASNTRTHGGARRAVVPNGWPEGLPRFVDHSVGQEEISIQAMGLVGVPYRWGGNTVAGGFDCSGLVQYIISRAANVDLPRTTEQMGHIGQAIDPDEVAPGDLLFFNTTGRAHSHVGIYVGANRFVNAPSTGGTVRIDYINNIYWAKHFDGIRRVAPPRDLPAPLPSEPQPVYAQSPLPRAADAQPQAAPSRPSDVTAQALPRVEPSYRPAQPELLPKTQLASARAPAVEAPSTETPPPASATATNSAAVADDPLMSLVGHSDGAEATPLNAIPITAASPTPATQQADLPAAPAPGDATPSVTTSVAPPAPRPLPAAIAGTTQDPIAQFAHDSF
ncbi:MAG: NlpC/P60 family protein [Janthinobacterium lividum]